MFNNSNMTDTTGGAESVTLSEHLSASPLFKEFCTAIFSFLCSFFLLIIVCLFPPFSFCYCIVFQSILGVVLPINLFSASYCPSIYFRRRIAHQSIFGVVLPINPCSASYFPLIHFRRRIAHLSIFGVVLPINPFSASYCPF
jgi:hypothetical protein